MKRAGKAISTTQLELTGIGSKDVASSMTLNIVGRTVGGHMVCIYFSLWPSVSTWTQIT